MVLMSTDTTFITNEKDNKLIDRFNVLIKDTVYFDVLVGYFYTSGFYKMYKSLENTKKIRILVGISTDKKTYDLIQQSKSIPNLSHAETKNKFSSDVKNELNKSEDSLNVEEGIKTFIKWLKSGKLEIKAYRDTNIHAKLYLSTFENGLDDGRVITGSSNFTKAGLQDNLEFNVELKDSRDYKFALDKFNELWKDAVDVSEPYINTITKETWLNDEITPYELFLKYLYEYFRENINSDKEGMDLPDKPPGFMDLQYQNDAVLDAEKKLAAHGGVFLSDVVGLGKTYMGALLAKKIKGKTLVIAPPTLLKWENPGSWRNAMYDFNNNFIAISKGKLDHALEGNCNYDNVIVDEAHEFRNEDTQSFEKLHRICKGKNVILVTATPFNNRPLDILAQIKLFQPSHKSSLPNPKVRNLEIYFNNIQKNLDRLKHQDESVYFNAVKEYSNDIRENVLKEIMVRRTRTSVAKHYKKDLEKQGLNFPDVQNPVPIAYELDDELDRVFNQTLDLIVNDFSYSRYTPLLYLIDENELNKVKAPQMNMGKFMKTLLLKRLESSFYAFKKSIDRFIYSYEKFIEMYDSGNVYISKKKINKIYKYLDEENDDLIESDGKNKIEELIKSGDADKFPSNAFSSKLKDDLEKDLNVLKLIKSLWKGINHDPKLERFKEILNNKKVLQNKVIVFTESEETMNYLVDNLNPLFDDMVFGFSGSSPNSDKRVIIDNFDGKAPHLEGTGPAPDKEYRILIATEVLSQGMNLHQSNVVINYDIPWNPTRMMQRVGRVQRVDTKFDEIFIYNFFPASKISENLTLEKAVEAKLSAFIEMLGNDSKLLTDEEIKSHDLFEKLTSKETVVGEEEEDLELKYLTFIRDIRDNNEELFKKIKNLPKKARTGKKSTVGVIDEIKLDNDSLLTFFRRGYFTKTYLNIGDNVLDLGFENTVQLLEANENTKKEKIFESYFDLLKRNKLEFEDLFTKEGEFNDIKLGINQNKLKKILLAIKNNYKFTPEEKDVCISIVDLIDDGSILKNTVSKILKKINELEEKDEVKIYHTIKNSLDSSYFEKTINVDDEKPKEIILSEYLIKGD